MANNSGNVPYIQPYSEDEGVLAGIIVPESSLFFREELSIGESDNTNDTVNYICAAITINPIYNDSIINVAWSQNDEQINPTRSYKIGKSKKSAQQLIDCQDLHNMPKIQGDWNVNVINDGVTLYSRDFIIGDLYERLKQYISIDANIISPETMPEGKSVERLKMLKNYTVIALKYLGGENIGKNSYLPNIKFSSIKLPYIYGATDSYLLVNNENKLMNLLNDDAFSFAFPDIAKSMNENNFIIHDNETKKAILYFSKIDNMPETLDLIIPINFCGSDCNFKPLKINYKIKLIEKTNQNDKQ